MRMTDFFLAVGWFLAVRGYPVAGGALWGLLAFKPVWALAFILVPLVTGRFRFCIATTTCGLHESSSLLALHGWCSASLRGSCSGCAIAISSPDAAARFPSSFWLKEF